MARLSERLVVGRVRTAAAYLGGADAAHPHGRVVGRVRGHGVDRTGLGAHHHDRPAGGRRVAAGLVVALLGSYGLRRLLDLGGQGVVGHLLEVGVEVGDQVVAGHRRGGLERAGHLARGVDLELLAARGAPQLATRTGTRGRTARRRRRPGSPWAPRDLSSAALMVADVAEDLGRRVVALGRAGQLGLGIGPLGGLDRGHAGELGLVLLDVEDVGQRGRWSGWAPACTGCSCWSAMVAWTCGSSRRPGRPGADDLGVLLGRRAGQGDLLGHHVADQRIARSGRG